jgi:hypothetical protein
MVRRRDMVIGVVLAGVVGLTFAAEQRSASGPPIQGVWRIAEVRTSGPGARTITNPNPGLLIFTARHYAIVAEAGDSLRPPVGDLAKASADQLRNILGFQANAGTYELSGDVLTTRPSVALNPSVMTAGAFLARSFKLDGNTLTTVQLQNQDGPISNPVSLKLTRVE